MNKNILLVLILGVFMNISFANEWKIQDNPYYKHKKSQFEMLKNSENYKVMMIGDSITDEGEWSELFEIKVQNRGISGDTTSGVIDRLDSLSPSVKTAFIMIGVNDIMLGKDIGEVYKNYVQILNTFKEKGIKTYIQSTLFIGETRMHNFNPKVEELNNKLRAYAKENNLIFIDLNPIFAPQKVLKKEFTSDDLHLNGTAYKLWAQEIKHYF